MHCVGTFQGLIAVDRDVKVQAAVALPGTLIRKQDVSTDHVHST